MHSLELRIPPVVLLAGFAVAMGGLARWVPRATVMVTPWWLASLPVLAGGLVSLAGVLAFRAARTTVNPVTPDASSAIVVTGVYRLSRNPMYLGFLFALVGWASWLGNAVSALALPAFVLYMNRFQIRPEERALHARFGAAYAEYTRRVRRWL